MADNIYAQFGDIKGSSTDSKWKEWTKLSSLSHGVEMMGSGERDTGGGSSTGRAQHGDIEFEKVYDAASTDMMDHMLKNKATATDATSSPAQDTKDEPQWKALQDDYMLNPKKNWDEESSDDEEDGDDGPPEQGRDAKGKKKRKRTAVRFK